MKKKVNKEIVEAEINLRKISGVIKQNGRKILKHYPITSPQFIALQWITENEYLTIGDLSSKIGLAFSTTTDLVDRMEKNGLVKRVRGSDDKRVVYVSVLKKGKDIINEVIEKRQGYLGDVLAGFSKTKAKELNELLNIVLTRMNDVDERERNGDELK